MLFLIGLGGQSWLSSTVSFDPYLYVLPSFFVYVLLVDSITCALNHLPSQIQILFPENSTPWLHMVRCTILPHLMANGTPCHTSSIYNIQIHRSVSH